MMFRSVERRWVWLLLVTFVCASCSAPTATDQSANMPPTSTVAPTAMPTATPDWAALTLTSTPTSNETYALESTADEASPAPTPVVVFPNPNNSEPLPTGMITETVVADTEGFVVAMAFAPDGRLFYTTKGNAGGLAESNDDALATVRIVDPDGTLRPTPFLSTPVNVHGERGLIGIAFDPQFEENHYVYIYKTAPGSETDDGQPSNRVIRYTEDPQTQTAILESETILMDLPIAETDHNVHVSGNLRFGPDGKLYVAVGDYGHAIYAPDLSVAMGKIHRINPDGSVPDDNPFAGDPDAVQTIWTYGNRNSFAFTFDPLSGGLFFTENGPGCDDEVNLAQPGGNYGWREPNARCAEFLPDTIPPLVRYALTIGITGIDVYMGPVDDWHGSLFWCEMNTGALHRGQLDDTRTVITDVTTIRQVPDCRVALQYGPDGALYMSSYNSIARIRPAATLQRDPIRERLEQSDR